MKSFILASASPRRFLLLKSLSLNFNVEIANINEDIKEGENPKAYALRISLEKAFKVSSLTKSKKIILAADTIVYIDNVLFDKPKNLNEAKLILTNLSNNIHNVSTAYCLVKENKVLKQNFITTKVKFRNLTEKEIEIYLKTGDFLDKAGAYGIQSEGAFLVDEISGSYTNIIGLPIKEVYEDLKIFNI